MSDADALSGFDADARARQWQAADEADVVAQIAGPNPHMTDMGLPDGLEEDGGA